ncbi:MAG: trypsin-like peptidase domain-containing protein [Akkermansiaceae bacterium]|jgi:serine protease Do|nr:trypsin-like peptidase domain-containing protein [Luteolibacter sp.]
MSSTIKRILSLLCVFVFFFVMVTLLKTWQAGGDFGALIPSFLRFSQKKSTQTFTPSNKAVLNLGDVQILSRLNQEYAKLTKAVVPSVVSIDTAGVRTEQQVDVFGRIRVRSYPTQGQGSGVIVSREGHIITNHHVIAGQQDIRITTHAGKTYGATMIGEDSLLDIAVIKIDSNETFTPLKFGNSSSVEVGQIVFAIGNPFGLGETVTQGIISAKERSLSDNQRDLFQTDAAINPGNSGGPLVNLTGEIIGINVAIFSVDKNNPSFQGVSFSIPSNEVKDTLEQIIKRGKPIRGFLGVRMRDLDTMVRRELGYQDENGSAVYVITPGSPAELAGLLPGDVILKYNDEKITSTQQLISLVQQSNVDEVVKIEIWRKGEIMNFQATIRESVSIESNSNNPLQDKEKINLGILNTIGISVRNLSGIEARRGFGGVVATMISPNTLASGLIQPDDLIIALNNSQITNTDEFYLQLAASVPKQETILHLIRGGQPLRVNLPKL